MSDESLRSGSPEYGRSWARERVPADPTPAQVRIKEATERAIRADEREKVRQQVVASLREWEHSDPDYEDNDCVSWLEERVFGVGVGQRAPDAQPPRPTIGNTEGIPGHKRPGPDHVDYFGGLLEDDQTQTPPRLPSPQKNREKIERGDYRDLRGRLVHDGDVWTPEKEQ